MFKSCLTFGAVAEKSTDALQVAGVARTKYLYELQILYVCFLKDPRHMNYYNDMAKSKNK